MENDGDRTISAWDVGIFSRELAEEEKQAGIQGQWQQESPAKEYLEQVKYCHDTDCNEPMMKKGFTALKNGTWEEYKETFGKKMKASEWAFDRIKEAFDLVAQDEAEKNEHCARDHAQKYGLFAVNHCARWRTRRSHNVVPVPALQQFPLGRLHLVCLWGKSFECWCAIRGEKYDWRQPDRPLVVQTGESFEQAKVFRAHAVPQGLCGNLINALKLLANQREDGDGLQQNIVTNLGKESRKGLTDGLQEFMWVDNERALDVGSLRRGTGTFKVRKPKAPEGRSDVIVRERPG